MGRMLVLVRFSRGQTECLDLYKPSIYLCLFAYCLMFMFPNSVNSELRICAPHWDENLESIVTVGNPSWFEDYLDCRSLQRF